MRPVKGMAAKPMKESDTRVVAGIAFDVPGGVESTPYGIEERVVCENANLSGLVGWPVQLSVRSTMGV